VKIEPNGAAGTYLREHIRAGDALNVSSPRGGFILESGELPLVLLSAGIGATPVLAMLYALAEARSTRQILWIQAARDRDHHPFVDEVHLRGVLTGQYLEFENVAGNVDAHEQSCVKTAGEDASRDCAIHEVANGSRDAKKEMDEIDPYQFQRWRTPGRMIHDLALYWNREFPATASDTEQGLTNPAFSCREQ
jgi:ferredoxin-NADP reductase